MDKPIKDLRVDSTEFNSYLDAKRTKRDTMYSKEDIANLGEIVRAYDKLNYESLTEKDLEQKKKELTDLLKKASDIQNSLKNEQDNYKRNYGDAIKSMERSIDIILRTVQHCLKYIPYVKYKKLPDITQEDWDKIFKK